MYRYAAFVVALAFVTVLRQSHGTEVNVTDGQGKLCLYANLMVNFSVTYEITGNKSSTVKFPLPAKVTSDKSACGDKSAMLKLDFGDGHSWSMNFTVSGKAYQADVISFSYNLGDETTFPDSASHETSTVTVTPHISDVTMDTCYSCKSNDMFETTLVNQTLWNVLIQAFVNNGSKSDRVTSCAADVPTTTVPTTTVPTTTVPTTTVPTTTVSPTTVAPTTHASNATTAAPVTNATSTTPPSTTAPTPTLPTPSVGNYTVKTNETICLLASFGLRIGVKQGDKYEEMNFETNRTTVNGSCAVDTSELELISPTMLITFRFTNDSKKFRLHAVNISGTTTSGAVFVGGNTNLTMWEASVGSSYMCNKEQNYTITSALTLFTFDLQVQPFGVKKGVFSTAYECSMDDTSILIPIIVGAALAGLILIVVIAYVIGRRKTYVGYQTL